MGAGRGLPARHEVGLPSELAGEEALKPFLDVLPDAQFYPSTNASGRPADGAFKSLFGQLQSKPAQDVLTADPGTGRRGLTADLPAQATERFENIHEPDDRVLEPRGGGHRPPPHPEPAKAPARGKPTGARAKDLLQALPWIGPALLLIFGVVLFPAGVMFFNSTRDISLSGLDKGSVGFDNFATVFAFAEFWPILGRTVIWVVVGRAVHGA